MARNSLYLLSFLPQQQRYSITRNAESLPQEITSSQQRWEAWLNTISSFAFEGRSGGHYTLRKERLQRGDVYWYAYRSLQGHTRKRYGGKTHDLTLERLEEVCSLFIDQESAGSTRSYMQARQQAASAPPLLESKLHPPRLAIALVERPRLLERLNASLAHKVTLIQGPAGSGKTTQVNQWLAAYRDTEYAQRLTASASQSAASQLSRVAWISLDASDNDPFRFWRYVMTACQQLLEPEGRAAGQAALSLLTTASRPPFDADPIDIALTHLLNALADPASGGWLVLDDYHVINTARIHETMTFFIDHLPASVHILLLSRAEPELPLLRWRARGELSELHGTDLRFSLDETALFLRQALPVTLSIEVLTRLDKSLEGWAAGLRLLSLTLSGWRDSQTIEQALISLGRRMDVVGPERAWDVGSPHRDLLDYFVSEILEAQPKPVQDFLLQTSMLSRLCGPLCDAITMSDGSETRLEAVARAGLFLETMAGPGSWYRYHALFADAMRREAGRRLGEERLHICLQRASRWYEQEGLLAEAIDTALPTRDMERVARLIDQFNEQHFYEPYTMVHWLEQLPEETLRKYPLLCLLFATEIHFPPRIRFSQKAISDAEIPPLSEAEHARGEALLRMAEDGYPDTGDLGWIGAIWAHRALDALLHQDSFPSVVNFAQRALAFLPQEGALDRRLQMYRSSCRLFVGIEKLRLGLISEAQQMLFQAREDNVWPGNKFLAADIHLMLGRSYLAQGERKLAQRYLGCALSDAREMNDGAVIVDALLELAWLAFEAQNIEATQQYIQEAQELVQFIQPPIQALHASIALQTALLQHARGETQAALEQLTALEAEQGATTWTSRGFWFVSRLHEWQERLQSEAQQIRLTGHGSLVEPLSLQEERILQLLVAGRSNQDIARELIVSVNTVKYHIKHLYQKLGVSNRLQASEAARRLLASH